jgi:hypothetical protein
MERHTKHQIKEPVADTNASPVKDLFAWFVKAHQDFRNTQTMIEKTRTFF